MDEQLLNGHARLKIKDRLHLDNRFSFAKTVIALWEAELSIKRALG